ncbi:hypothetical protein D0Z07_4728 [Hyphodiscus hymeniophilus]|uniref:ADF-H domain-containing protein n=1 Tax=Hyphodiscus hymeniophilus TaxID=353542 RepID=A0A9P6VJG6_9HELO|nr:hypothetical protein D0Z07_4728 [Hyphodiscus hymeniophilus]
MSLNGLDEVKVREAYEIAAVEPGGWFLLKYVSRDEVELLGRGNGGIVEIRNTIAQFEESTPLFGFLRYRRRNVIIKYVPDDCSRLVQARVTVHFTAVTEHFSPHDTEFSINSSKELRDTTLSAACSLHTASGSTSSSTSSLRRRRLMEIAEDAEEDAKRQSTVPEERPSTAKAPSITAVLAPLPALPPTLPNASSYRSVISDLDTFPPPPREPQLDIRPSSPTKTLDERRRKSSQSDMHDTLAMLNGMSKADDSGISFDASSTMKTDESDATRSDSYPVSPVGPSERADSTKASSISESTDETVQDANITKLAPREPQETERQSQYTMQQTQVTNTPTLGAVDKNVNEVEDLPLLRPVAYIPLQIPVPIEVRPLADASLEGKDLKPSDAVAEALTEPVFYEGVSPEDAPEGSVPEKIAQASSTEAATAEHEVQTQAEPIALPTSTVKPEIDGWKVPRSKFSSQNLLAASEDPVLPAEPLPLSLSVTATNFAPKSPVGSTFSADIMRSSIDDDGEEKDPLSSKRKRRTIVEPIRTDLDMTDISATDSIANMSSDDELMDELQSAVLQEAQPMSVAKSPISSVFPSPIKRVGNRFSRAFSSPMRKDTPGSQTLSPPEIGRSDSSRSVSASAAYLSRISSEPAKPLAKKVNLGSGISQRIKALEKLSANAPGASPSTGVVPPSTGASPAFFSVRKGSVQAASRSPSIVERATSLTRNTPSPSPSASRDSSPETFKLRERSGSIQDRLNAFISAPILTKSQHSRPESISVTARIIRDPDQPFPKGEVGKNPSEYAPLDLKQSPLVIDHQKAIKPPQPPNETIQERRLSTSSRTTTKSRRSSITVVRDLIKEGRSSFAERRRSINLEPLVPPPSLTSPGRSPSRPPSVHQSPAHQRPISISSRRSSRDTAFSPPLTAGSSSSTNDEKEKKSNLTSRMIRRMSSSLSSGRKALTHSMSPTVREESEFLGPESRSLTSSHPSNYSMTPSTTSTNIGDVNVQFPDSLLWKRRSMLLDSQGTLILSPALSNGNNSKEKTSGATRRFHLSEFRTPGVPDVEMQELPNSVVLDFIEGSGLQIACEDRAGQVRVLGGQLFYISSVFVS